MCIRDRSHKNVQLCRYVKFIFKESKINFYVVSLFHYLTYFQCTSHLYTNKDIWLSCIAYLVQVSRSLNPVGYYNRNHWILILLLFSQNVLLMLRVSTLFRLRVGVCWSASIHPPINHEVNIINKLIKNWRLLLSCFRQLTKN